MSWIIVNVALGAVFFLAMVVAALLVLRSGLQPADRPTAEPVIAPVPDQRVAAAPAPVLEPH